jgi:hypothetical protein
MTTDETPERDLLPEEEAAGSDDPEAETAAILEDSEARAEQREDSGDTVEHRRSETTT